MTHQQTPTNQELRTAGYSQAEIDLMTDEERRKEYDELLQNWYSSNRRGRQNDTSMPA